MVERAATQPAVLPPRSDAAQHRQPGDVLRLILVAGMALLVRRGHVGTLEADLFRHLNHLPNALALPLGLVMQLGAYPAALVAAAIAVALRRLRLAGELLAAGTLAWVLGKAVKALVERERPAPILFHARATSLRPRPVLSNVRCRPLSPPAPSEASLPLAGPPQPALSYASTTPQRRRLSCIQMR